MRVYTPLLPSLLCFVFVVDSGLLACYTCLHRPNGIKCVVVKGQRPSPKFILKYTYVCVLSSYLNHKSIGELQRPLCRVEQPSQSSQLTIPCQNLRHVSLLSGQNGICMSALHPHYINLFRLVLVTAERGPKLLNL